MAKQNWFEQERFWKIWMPYMFVPQRLARTPADVDGLVARLKLKPGARVLDMCCGPGRHAIELARRGFRVTGVDRTAFYLQKARRDARQARVDVEFIQRDARRFSRPRAFDAAINMFSSFGFFADQRDDERLVRNLWRSLKPGGGLLMEMVGKERLAQILRPRDWNEIDGAFVLEERKVRPDWSGLDNRWIMFRNGRKHEFRFSLRIYSGMELANLMRRAGFRRVQLCGSLEGAAYDDAAQRLVAVARK